MNLFLEDSTRTRTSFALAARRLGCEVVDFAASSSSLSKGESLVDTAETLIAAGASVIVLRHPEAGAADHLAGALGRSPGPSVPIINAGDGRHAHPTQALLDAFTIRERLGVIEGKRILIVGDVLHSRVARSVVALLAKLGATVAVAGPPALVPDSLGEALDVDVHHERAAALHGIDIVYLLRIQLERQGRGAYAPLSMYRRRWGVSAALLDEHCPKALVMHPGPMNRGVEIEDDVLHRPTCAVLDQVAAGVPVRMAVLRRALRQGPWAEGARA
jgi:aspartate carbamoyltransferase catalytic subunit